MVFHNTVMLLFSKSHLRTKGRDSWFYVPFLFLSPSGISWLLTVSLKKLYCDLGTTALPLRVTIPKDKMGGEDTGHSLVRVMGSSPCMRRGGRVHEQERMRTMQNHRGEPGMPKRSGCSLTLAVLEPSKIHSFRAWFVRLRICFFR